MKKKQRKKKSKKNKFSIKKLFLSFVAVIIIVLSCIFGYFYVKEDYDTQKAFTSFKEFILIKPKPVNVLVLGVSTDISTELSDTIMICSYNPDKQSAYLLSIPRDSFVGDNKNNAKGKDKINALYTSIGPAEMKKRVEQLIGVDIDYYVVVKNDALIDIVDSIGGIDFDVPIDMDYDDITQDLHIHLKAGMQHIDGDKAEQLLRFRHNNDGTSYPGNYGDNDYGRMKTQRNFIVETAKQTLKFSNILKLNKIAVSVSKNVETDMGFLKIISYIPSGLKFDTNSISSYQIPGKAQKINSIWFYEIDTAKTKDLISELK